MQNMKKFFYSICVFLISVSTSPAREIVRLSNGEWPPYLSQTLPDQGAASQIVKAAFDAVDVDVEYVFRPWKRAYRYAATGYAEGRVCHGTVVWVYTAERAKIFHYSDVVIEDNEVLFHLHEKPLKWQKIEDLHGKVIGGTAHTTYPLLENAEKQGILSIQRAGNYDTLFSRLLAGRIDAVPQVKNVGNYYLQNFLEDSERGRITYSPTVMDSRKYHVLFSRISDSDFHFLLRFNRGLQIIKENGVYAKIIDDLEKGKYFQKAQIDRK